MFPKYAQPHVLDPVEERAHVTDLHSQCVPADGQPASAQHTAFTAASDVSLHDDVEVVATFVAVHTHE